MTEDELDRATLNALAGLIDPVDANLETVKLFRRIWADRRAFLDALGAIATWDLAHSEALTVERAVDIATDAIVKHSEL
jgi:hypothetical protein